MEHASSTLLKIHSDVGWYNITFANGIKWLIYELYLRIFNKNLGDNVNFS